MLELLESILGCLVRHSFSFLVLFFPSLSGCSLTYYSTSVCQALRNQAYTKIRYGTSRLPAEENVTIFRCNSHSSRLSGLLVGNLHTC